MIRVPLRQEEEFSAILEDAGIEYKVTFAYLDVEFEVSRDNEDEAEELLREYLNDNR